MWLSATNTGCFFALSFMIRMKALEAQKRYNAAQKFSVSGKVYEIIMSSHHLGGD